MLYYTKRINEIDDIIRHDPNISEATRSQLLQMLQSLHFEIDLRYKQSKEKDHD